MKTKEFLREHSACAEGAKWAMSVSDDMADVWDEMIRHEKYDWLLWTITRPGIFPDSVLRKLVCRFVRETPLPDGRTVWALLKDNRSRKAVEVAERYAIGEATDDELREAARAAARAVYAVYAADVAYSAAAYAAADAAYSAAAYAAADAAADAADAAKAAQVKMIAEMGNPFKERAKR